MGEGRVDAEYWKGRWRRGELGWHADKPNPGIIEVFPSLDLPPGSRILVPLCGKSLDMGWLLSAGYGVVGVEVSPLACAAVFESLGVEPRSSTSGPFEVWEHGDLRLLCGDVFRLRAEDVGEVSGWYDRAALIALDPLQRQRYRVVMERILCPGARGLLLALSYPPHEKQGPPFTVPESEILEQWGEGFTVDVVARADVLDEDPKFRRWGLSRLEQTTYTLKRL